MNRIYFIINPNAGNGQCLTIWKQIEEHLLKRNVPFFPFFTEHPGHGRLIASQIAGMNQGHTVIIALGGDGTIHEVANGVINHSHVTLGFIPGGSGNDFSRGFQLPKVPAEALEVILRLWKQQGVTADIGKITLEGAPTSFFINSMGAGFDAVISYEVNRSSLKALFNKLSLGRLIYVYFLLKKLFTYKTSTIHLSIDGKKHIFEKTWFVTVSNQPYYGGGMRIAPLALVDDGLFDVTVVHQLSRLKLLLIFISVFWGKHIHFKEVKLYRGVEISIESNSPLHVHADGEHIGYTPLTIFLQRNCLRVLTRGLRKGETDLRERDSNGFY